MNDAATSSGGLGALGASLIALLLVVALIIALGWLLRRLPGAGQGLRGHPQLRVVAQLSVGVRERLLVVAVGDTQHLIGVSGERITLLSTLDTPLGEAPPSEFARLLSRQRGAGS